MANNKEPGSVRGKKTKRAEKDVEKAVLSRYERERSQFSTLIAINPNYFGNLAESPFEAELDIQSNTTYEEIGCLGFNPKQNYLEAVVFIKHSTGYGGGICSDGSREYVRFFLSFDNGATWSDQGLTSFKVYNIPEGTEGSKRLEYDATLAIKPSKKFCFMNNTAKVRAILSWNFAPPPDPNFIPVWGEVQEAYIQIDPLKLFLFGDLLKAVELKPPAKLSAVIDPDQALEASAPKVLGLAELHQLYQDKGVEPHRYGFVEMQRMVSGSVSGEALIEGGLKQLLPDVKVDIDYLVVDLLPADGNTRYEELECVGLNTNTNKLVGAVRIKRPSGYSGGPCTAGSVEYVTFWGDFNHNGIYETCLGTVSVTVHDIAAIPPEGLMYAVELPVDLKHYRKPCEEGPVVVPIRAILSWQVAPPCWNPNYVPTWGNREETLVHITPGPEIPFGTVVPKISAIGNVPTGDIHDFIGLTTTGAVFADIGTLVDALGRGCPFGGRLNIIGESYPGYKYHIQVRKVGEPGWTTLIDPLKLVDSDGNKHIHNHDGTGKFDFLPVSQNMFNLLGVWKSSADDLWQVRLQIFDSSDVLQPGVALHRVMLDNTWPEAEISITTGSGNCGKFTPGTLLAGRFVARDTYFESYSLVVKPPVNLSGIGIPAPQGGTLPTAISPGDIWNLDTTDMIPCGYIIEVHAYDRAVVDSGHSGHHRSASAGFCLDEPQD